MNRSNAPLSLLTMASSLIISAALIGCGPPELCQQEGAGSFSQFRSSNWSPYCADLQERLQQPLDYELISLTEFFSEYPERASMTRSKLAKFDEYEQCFVSREDKLEYRKLNSCMNEPDVEGRIKRAWSVRAEPWLDDYQLRVKKIAKDLSDTTRDADYITQKINQQERLGAPVNVDRIKDFGDALDDLQREVAQIDRATDDFERLRSSSMAYEGLNEHIEAMVGDELKAMFDDHDKNRFSIARMRGTQRFHNFAIASVGIPCKEGIKARSEQRTAKKILGPNIEKIGAGKIIAITSKTDKSTDESTGEQTESFKGYICGKRGIDNQFDGQFPLCATHTFVATRIKPADARRFEAWSITSFKEGKEQDGVDCNMLDGPPK